MEKFPQHIIKYATEHHIPLDYSKFNICKESIYSSLMPWQIPQVKKILQTAVEKPTFIIDGTAHIGCDTINFAQTFPATIITAIEKDEKVFTLLKENIRLFGYNIKAVNDDFINFIQTHTFEPMPTLLFLDPPWGGKKYKEQELIMLSLSEHTITNIIRYIFSKKNSMYVTLVLKAPYNLDFNKFKDNLDTVPITIKKYDIFKPNRTIYYSLIIVNYYKSELMSLVHRDTVIMKKYDGELLHVEPTELSGTINTLIHELNESVYKRMARDIIDQNTFMIFMNFHNKFISINNNYTSDINDLNIRLFIDKLETIEDLGYLGDILTDHELTITEDLFYLLVAYNRNEKFIQDAKKLHFRSQSYVQSLTIPDNIIMYQCVTDLLFLKNLTVKPYYSTVNATGRLSKYTFDSSDYQNTVLKPLYNDNCCKTALIQLLKKRIRVSTVEEIEEIIKTSSFDHNIYNTLQSIMNNRGGVWGDETFNPNSITQRAKNRIMDFKDYLGVSIKSILDIGTGNGEIFSGFGNHLNIQKQNLVAIDTDYYGSEELLKRITFKQVRSYQSINIARTFDLILMFQVLHHIKDLDIKLREIYQLLSPDGFLFVREHDCIDDNIAKLIEAEHVLYEINENSTYNDAIKNVVELQYFSQQDWNSILFHYGFELVKIVNITVGSNPTRYYNAVYKKK